MNDTLTVRDHSEKCNHGYKVGHIPGNDLEWCPGGREIVLFDEAMIERAAKTLDQLFPDDDLDTLWMAGRVLRAVLEVPDV